MVGAVVIISYVWLAWFLGFSYLIYDELVLCCCVAVDILLILWLRRGASGGDSAARDSDGISAWEHTKHVVKTKRDNWL